MEFIGDLKYSHGVIFFPFPWISNINRVYSKKSWIPLQESIYNLHVLSFILFNILLVSLNGVYWGSLNTATGIFFSILLD